MSAPTDCSQNIDPLKLVRDGTDHAARFPRALDPAYAPVNDRGPAHGIVFAQKYAALLKYFNQKDQESETWSPFFNSDVSVVLAVPAIENVDAYKTEVQAFFDYLNDNANQAAEAQLKNKLGFLFSCVASLAQRLDSLKKSLPLDMPLRGVLQNLIKTQLAPAFKRLIGYYKAGLVRSLVTADPPQLQILGYPAVSIESVLSSGLSNHWSEGGEWTPYEVGIDVDPSVYGRSTSVFQQINHCSTHTLFKSVFDQFLKVYSRIARDARAALENTLTKRDTHEPHYALYLAFLRLLEYGRTAGNQLTRRHLDFYYKVILGLKEKSPLAGQAHVLTELARQAGTHLFKAGILFRAGKDDQGKDVVFANVNDFVANRAKLVAFQTLYRHGAEPVATSATQQARLFASPVANSDDGIGAALTSPDGSWHPFFNKIYRDGALQEVRMPHAEIGFAIASHYLLMAEGRREVTLVLTVTGYTGQAANYDFRDGITCLLTTAEGWLEKQPLSFIAQTANQFRMDLVIEGDSPPIVPYSAKVHGNSYASEMPVLVVRLKQDESQPYAYPAFQNVQVSNIALTVHVTGMKSLAASNDFGPLDTSKPFQPFGYSPVAGSSLIIGSTEVFQKNLSSLVVNLSWLAKPTAYPTDEALPKIEVDFLQAGAWQPITEFSLPIWAEDSKGYELPKDLDKPVVDAPDFATNSFYGTQSRHGFVKLRLTRNFGQDTYQAALLEYLRKDADATAARAKRATDPRAERAIALEAELAFDPDSKPPAGPIASSLTLDYTADSTLALDSAQKSNFEIRQGQFFHLTPFGTAEQHPYLNTRGNVYLFPHFEVQTNTDTLSSEAEFYIGVSGLVPPQSLSILFQVADGTANPLASKPVPHISWSYLKQNEWVEFASNEIQDATDELTNSGIVTLAVPREATSSNTLFQNGLFWIRAAVHERSDAVCRLQLVAAQAMTCVYTDRGNAPGFSTNPLPAGTISKLEAPDAAVKSITQPYPSFGGRGAEQGEFFYARISERLRHKNRAINLWDYERLILEAFPQIYKVKCLNHTCYEPSDSGTGIYRELAPGHVTIVTIPNVQAQNQLDPLKPYTSLSLLQEIKELLQARSNCFVQLHVKNPQFEEVRVRFSVRLYDGFDETYYSNLLAQAITQFLSPWAFAGGGSPSFGGKVYKSVLINFVEEQSYVDYLTDFQLFQDIGGVQGSVDLEAVEGSRAVSILVSAPAARHEITLIKSAQDDALSETCRCQA